MVNSQVEALNKIIEPKAEILMNRSSLQRNLLSKEMPVEFRKVMNHNILMCISCVCMGYTSIIPPFDTAKPETVNPDLYIRALRIFAPVPFSFCSPIVWIKIINYCFENKIPLSKDMVALICGGAPVPLKLHMILRNNLNSLPFENSLKGEFIEKLQKLISEGQGSSNFDKTEQLLEYLLLQKKNFAGDVLGIQDELILNKRKQILEQGTHQFDHFQMIPNDCELLTPYGATGFFSFGNFCRFLHSTSPKQNKNQNVCQ